MTSSIIHPVVDQAGDFPEANTFSRAAFVEVAKSINHTVDRMFTRVDFERADYLVQEVLVMLPRRVHVYRARPIFIDSGSLL